ncbi:translational activator GCN1, partial [Planoprotostelium fungivorum]
GQLLINANLVEDMAAIQFQCVHYFIDVLLCFCRGKNPLPTGPVHSLALLQRRRKRKRRAMSADYWQGQNINCHGGLTFEDKLFLLEDYKSSKLKNVQGELPVDVSEDITIIATPPSSRPPDPEVIGSPAPSPPGFIRMHRSIQKKAAQIVGNIITGSIPEVIAINSKAVGSLIQGMGEDRFSRLILDNIKSNVGSVGSVLGHETKGLLVWKKVIQNASKALKALLIDLMRIIIGCLGSTMDKRQVSGKTLGHLVEKLGDNILSEINPILEKDFDFTRKATSDRTPRTHPRRAPCSERKFKTEGESRMITNSKPQSRISDEGAKRRKGQKRSTVFSLTGPSAITVDTNTAEERLCCFNFQFSFSAQMQPSGGIRMDEESGSDLGCRCACNSRMLELDVLRMGCIEVQLGTSQRRLETRPSRITRLAMGSQ